MVRSLLASLLTAALLLGGCAHLQPPAAGFDEPVYMAHYQLDSGDRLRVIVFGQDSLSNIYAVDSTGSISMPLIGRIGSRGLTPQVLERHVEQRLREGFLREPKVSIEVEQYRPFFILGEVTQPGQYPYVNGLTVQTAIAIAGGFTARGSQRTAEITRIVNGETIVSRVPVTNPVRPGDTIAVKERFF